MKTVLLLSSQVACSPVGAGGGGFVLHSFGHEVIILPTVLMGRHPGWGDPGRVDIDETALQRLFAAVQAQGLLERLDAVLCGYFCSSGQVRAAAAMIDAVHAVRKNALVVVDPVMGDAPDGLYVSEEVAQAVQADLVARADVLCPNAWELARLAGAPVADEVAAVQAARALARPLVLVSSAPAATGRTGTMAVTPNAAWAVDAPHRSPVPHGTGDVLCALFTAQLLCGAKPPQALEMAHGALGDIIGEAARRRLPELPLVAMRQRLTRPGTGKLAFSRVRRLDEGPA